MASGNSFVGMFISFLLMITFTASILTFGSFLGEENGMHNYLNSSYFNYENVTSSLSESQGVVLTSEGSWVNDTMTPDSGEVLTPSWFGIIKNLYRTMFLPFNIIEEPVHKIFGVPYFITRTALVIIIILALFYIWRFFRLGE